MRRVVITGMGVVSSIGNNLKEVLDSLKDAKSGIKFQELYKQVGLRCQVAGSIHIDTDTLIDRKFSRFMGSAAMFAYIAMAEAIAMSGLTHNDISNPMTGLIAGSGGGSPTNQVEGVDILREKGIRRVGAFRVPRTMGSTVSACLATPFEIKGVNYSITSACSTSAHCIGNAYELIQMGKQNIVFAGGGEEEGWATSMMFDAMGALSSSYNETPQIASRAFDAKRDGFVPAGGGGILVLEELEHAKARGANIIAEVIGYGATSDGFDMVAPSGEGAIRCMQQALRTVKSKIDYINTHGTSTPVGDPKEIQAIKTVFGENTPYVNSTKSLTGHALGAAGANEAIYSLLMMQNNFVCKSANIVELDPEIEKIGVNIVRERIDNVKIDTVLSNSFGFGGTNATLVMQRYRG